MRPVIGHYRSHLDITSAGQEHQAKRSLMRRRRAEDAEHAKKRKLSVSLRSRGDSSRTIAGLERPQECDELFSFGWVQLQAEFVPLNSMGFGTRWEISHELAALGLRQRRHRPIVDHQNVDAA